MFLFFSPSELPGFKLAPGVLKHLKENTQDILPKHVFDSVWVKWFFTFEKICIFVISADALNSFI